MEFAHPFRVVTPTLDGEVLSVLALAEADFTPPQVHRVLGRHSEDGIRRALQRLTDQGIVSSRGAGRAVLYQLNRDHLAAPHLEAIARLAEEFRARARGLISGWTNPCEFAALFGSAVTGTMRADSDLDVFVVRPCGVEADDPSWRGQVDGFAAAATAWTGNDTRVLEYGSREVQDGLALGERVLAEIASQGICLFGDDGYLRRLRRDEGGEGEDATVHRRDTGRETGESTAVPRRSRDHRDDRR